jgi:hypothetical protein
MGTLPGVNLQDSRESIDSEKRPNKGVGYAPAIQFGLGMLLFFCDRVHVPISQIANLTPQSRRTSCSVDKCFLVI